MRKIVNSTYITLDGVIADPQLWPSLGSSDDRGGTIQTELLLASDVLIMGRHTYEVFAPVWPTRSGDPVSDRINTMPKYVVSSTLTDPEWDNTSVINPADAVGAITELKQQEGGHIIQYGFGQLSYTLMENDLLDEVRLWIHPFFVGSAGADDLLFRPGSTHHFELSDTIALRSGILIAMYTAARRG
jgi:dihydrofolate reductase